MTQYPENVWTDGQTEHFTGPFWLLLVVHLLWNLSKRLTNNFTSQSYVALQSISFAQVLN